MSPCLTGERYGERKGSVKPNGRIFGFPRGQFGFLIGKACNFLKLCFDRKVSVPGGRTQIGLLIGVCCLFPIS
jgi:hypothetical protein